ncbi:MAG: hypothetical protein K8R59_04125 [Thermoanaerobaculales bacterium]|nr:hypothetical protein [Thermoanaerobaculales bacterium]
MSNFFEHLIGQKSREGRRTLGAAAGAETSLLTACRHEKLGAAARTSHPGKTRLKSAAVKIGVDDIVDEGSPKAVTLLEVLLPDAPNLAVECLDQAVQGGLLRLAGTIEAGRRTFCDQGKLLPESQRGGITTGWPGSR